MNYYLLVFDRQEGALVRKIEDFPKSSDALTARFAAEAKYRGHPHIEVVVLGADSLDGLKRTHSRYFASPRELASKGIGRLVEKEERQRRRFRFAFAGR